MIVYGWGRNSAQLISQKPNATTHVLTTYSYISIFWIIQAKMNRKWQTLVTKKMISTQDENAQEEVVTTVGPEITRQEAAEVLGYEPIGLLGKLCNQSLLVALAGLFVLIVVGVVLG